MVIYIVQILLCLFIFMLNDSSFSSRTTLLIWKCKDLTSQSAEDEISNVYEQEKKFLTIVYKKTDEWYIEWQRMTTSDNELYNEWYNEWQRMTTSDKGW